MLAIARPRAGALVLHRSRWFSSANSILTREFIQDSLYHPSAGYFSKDIINSPSTALEFRGFLGEYHYKVALASLYKDKPGAWMTPSEVFAPHYSRAVGKWIMVSTMHVRVQARACNLQFSACGLARLSIDMKSLNRTCLPPATLLRPGRRAARGRGRRWRGNERPTRVPVFA